MAASAGQLYPATPPGPDIDGQRIGDALVQAARTQIGVTTGYDGAYRRLAYPGGDVDRTTGVCTDVLIRAYRDAFDFDLQRAVHEDMSVNFSAYPDRWGLNRPDRNIDHRRVPNLETYFARHGTEVQSGSAASDDLSFESGDIVSMRLPGGLPHIGIVAEAALDAGALIVIHNIGRGARQETLPRAITGVRGFRFLPG